MRNAVIVFYSYSGNTKLAAEILIKELQISNFKTSLIELQAADESDSFLRQAIRALFKRKARIQDNLNADLSAYDLIALGTPVWAFGMAPALRAYLDICRNITGKRILLFATYGSGVGKDKCVDEMSAIVKKMGAKDTVSFLIQQNDVKNRDLVKNRIQKALKNE